LPTPYSALRKTPNLWTPVSCGHDEGPGPNANGGANEARPAAKHPPTSIGRAGIVGILADIGHEVGSLERLSSSARRVQSTSPGLPLRISIGLPRSPTVYTTTAEQLSASTLLLLGRSDHVLNMAPLPGVGVLIQPPAYADWSGSQRLRAGWNTLTWSMKVPSGAAVPSSGWS